MMGFDREQCTVTLLWLLRAKHVFCYGGVNADFVPLEVVRRAAAAAGRSNISIMTIPRNVTALLQKGWVRLEKKWQARENW